MPGDVGRVGGARLAGGAERALRDAAVLGAREDGAPVLELVDVVRRLVAEDLDRVLVAEVVGALDRVEGVLLGSSSEAFPSAALIPPSAAPEWLRTGWIFEMSATSAPASMRLDGRAHARAAGPDDEHVVLRFHRIGRYRKKARLRPGDGCGDGSRWRSTGGHADHVLRMLRLDRHPLRTAGLCLGTRVHEWHLGAVLLLGVAVGALLDRVGDGFTTVAAIAAGLWLIAKDWRDVFPAQRDSAAWRLGLHPRAIRLGPFAALTRSQGRGRHRGAGRAS